MSELSVVKYTRVLYFVKPKSVVVMDSGDIWRWVSLYHKGSLVAGATIHPETEGFYRIRELDIMDNKYTMDKLWSAFEDYGDSNISYRTEEGIIYIFTTKGVITKPLSDYNKDKK